MKAASSVSFAIVKNFLFGKLQSFKNEGKNPTLVLLAVVLINLKSVSLMSVFLFRMSFQRCALVSL